MRRHHIIFWLFSLCAIIISCTKDDRVSENTDKRYEFVLSVGHQHGMRMANAVVQVDNNPFRGIQSLCVIPFRTTVSTTEADAVTANDFPLISIAMGTEANRVDGKDFYYIGLCSLRETANRVLVYGQSASYSTNPALNGKLNTEVGTYIVPADIMFSLQSICETDDAEDTEDDTFEPARDLAAYLTAIAGTTGWSTTTNSELKALYLDFIHADDTDGAGLMAGSAAHVKAYVKALRDQLGTDELSEAIKNTIDDEDLKACLDNGYPSGSESLGLPDGAAALRWIDSEKAFSVRTKTTTLDNINGIKRYTYPAELWYYVNSPIRTSEEKIGKTAYQTADDWDALLDNYDGNNTYITVNTQSVAVKDPLQYGVALLQMTLNAITADPLKDSNNDDVDYTEESGFKLTGVIIGGQHTVGFDFKPMEPQSDVDARFIYDTQVGSHVNNAAITVNTLVLQSYDEEKVPVILELENKTGHQFAGKDGIIYPDTKFYLVGQLDPAGKGEGAYANRVFTQDYTTEVAMTITSLANAYSCMPDLLSPRLEIGVQVQTKWIQSTPTIVKL